MKLSAKFWLLMLSGILVIAAVILLVGVLCYHVEKNKYYKQLEEVIDNKYLENRNAIGAFCYNVDSIEVKERSDLNLLDPQLKSMYVSNASLWGGLTLTHEDVTSKILQSGEYRWYNLKDCATNYGPFMIILEKTERGYDIIGEFIIGIGLKNIYPTSLITKKVQNFNFKDGQTYSFTNNMISSNMIYSYIESLFDEYNGITIHKEIIRENGREENKARIYEN